VSLPPSGRIALKRGERAAGILEKAWVRLRTLSCRQKALLLFLGALLPRVLLFHPVYLDLDTYYFYLMAESFRDHLFIPGPGADWHISHYIGTDHYPLLQPLLMGLLGTGGLDPETAAWIISIISGSALAALTYLLGRRLFKDEVVAFLAGVLVACAPPLIWHSSTGRSFTISFALTVAALIYTYDTAKTWHPLAAALAGFFWALAYYARFEGVAGFALALGWLAWSVYKLKADSPRPVISCLRRRALVGVGIFLLVGLMLSLPYLVKLRHQTGHWTVAPRFDDASRSLRALYETGLPLDRLAHFLPNPKGMDRVRTYLAALPAAAKSWLDNYPLLLVLMIVLGTWRRRKDEVVSFLWLFCLPALLFPLSESINQSYRFYSFTMPLLIPIAAAGLVDLYRGEVDLGLAARRRSLAVLLIVPLLVFWAWQFGHVAYPERPPFWNLGWLEHHLSLLMRPSGSFYFYSLMALEFLALVLFLRSRRTVQAALFPFLALGLLVLQIGYSGAGFGFASPFSSSYWQGLMRQYFENSWILIALLAALLIYYHQADGLLYHQRGRAFQAGLVCLALGWLLVAWGQNLLIRDFQYRGMVFADDPRPAVRILEGKVSPNTRLMCHTLGSAWLLKAHWVRLPPITPFSDFDLRLVQYIVGDNMPRPASVSLEQLDGLVSRGMLEVVGEERREDLRLYEGSALTRVYRVRHPGPGPDFPSYRPTGGGGNR